MVSLRYTSILRPKLVLFLVTLLSRYVCLRYMLCYNAMLVNAAMDVSRSLMINLNMYHLCAYRPT